MYEGMARRANSSHVGAKSTFETMSLQTEPGLIPGPLTRSCPVSRVGDRSEAQGAHRHLERLFVDESLVEPAVLAEEEALIRCVHDQSVLSKPAGLEVVQQPSNVVVDGPRSFSAPPHRVCADLEWHSLYRLEISLHVSLILPL